MTTTDSSAHLLRDLRWGVRTWATAPWFVLLVVLSVAATVAVQLWNPILGAACQLGYAGFLGAEWCFYLRRLTGRELLALDVPGVVLGYIGRYVRLAILVFLPLWIVLLVAIVVDRVPSAGVGELNERLRLIIVAYELLADVLLTFVAPSLAYSATSAVEALRRGLAQLRRTMPSSSWYALTPGLTFGLVAFVLPRSVLGVAATVAVAVPAGLLSFAFKGAIAPYFLRTLSDRDRRAGRADP